MKTQIEKLSELSDKKKSVVMNQYVDDLLRNGKHILYGAGIVEVTIIKRVIPKNWINFLQSMA